MKTNESPNWNTYEQGFPEDAKTGINLIRSEILSLKTSTKFLNEILLQDEGGKKPGEKQNQDEAPDFGPWLDVPNYKAKVRAIRTDSNGNYDGTTLELLQDIPNVGKKGKIMILRNKNWEKEFKRAQDKGLEICLRIGDKKVQSIEVLS